MIVDKVLPGNQTVDVGARLAGLVLVGKHGVAIGLLFRRFGVFLTNQIPSGIHETVFFFAGQCRDWLPHFHGVHAFDVGLHGVAAAEQFLRGRQIVHPHVDPVLLVDEFGQQFRFFAGEQFAAQNLAPGGMFLHVQLVARGFHTISGQDFTQIFRHVFHFQGEAFRVGQATVARGAERCVVKTIKKERQLEVVRVARKLKTERKGALYLYGN